MLIELGPVRPSSEIIPEWDRPSKVSAKFGIPRTTLYDWINRGWIKSASFKQPHQRHGLRLIEVKSVRDFIEAHVQAPQADCSLESNTK